MSVIAFSILVALVATALVAVPATLAGWALSRRWRGRSAVEALLTLPLVLPPTAVGLGLLLALGSRSPLGRLLDALGADVVFTRGAVVLAAAVVSFPLFLRSARAAIESVDRRFVDVARTLGHGRLRTLLLVEIPLAWRGLVAGGVLAFCRALGEFGATLVVAGSIPGRTRTIASSIYAGVQAGREGDALLLAGLAAIIAFVALLVVERLTAPRPLRGAS